MPFRALPFLTGLIASAAPAADFFYERIQRNVHRSPTGPISLLDYVDRAAFFPPHQLARLGTDYGGWIIPVEAGLTADTVCYCAGAGEDISFECALVEHYPCSVWIIDPTPRALEHFKLLSEAVSAERPFPINNGRENYSIAPRAFQRLYYLPVGLADRDTKLKFYLPRNPAHVSASAINLQQTEAYFRASCERVSTIMRSQEHSEIGLLKMNIEGSEYGVIQDLVATRMLPRLLLVEFDEAHTPIDAGAGRRIRRHIEMLVGAGMRCIAVEGPKASFLRYCGS